MFLYRLLYPEPPPVEIMEEVRKRTPVPLSFELIRQTEIFIEETLCMLCTRDASGPR